MDLDGNDALLYAATKAIGPKQLTKDEARDTARRAYSGNSSLSSTDIGKAIGRARRTVDSYIADLRAATQMGRDIKIFRMNRLGIPQDRIAERLGMIQGYVHLLAMVPPKVSISDYVGILKGRSAIRILNKFRKLKDKPYWGNKFWSRGYCVDTVGLDSEMIRKYVKYQEQKEITVEQRDLFGK